MKERESDDISTKPDAVRRLYEVFSRYRARADMPRCEHCAPLEEIEHLCAKRLSDLTGDELDFYTSHAITTVGEVIDFKYFLPRIFETMLWESGPVCVEIVVGKLPNAEWRKWPSEEQEAISGFLVDWWGHVLSQAPAEHEADSCLCAIALAEEDIARFLQHWRQQPGPEPVRHLAATVIYKARVFALEHHLVYSPWWVDSPIQMQQFLEWLLSSSTAESLEKAFIRFSQQPFAHELSEAIQSLEWLNQALGEKNK